MRKYINVRLDQSEDGRLDVNIDVLKSADQLSMGFGACGWLDEADLDDLYVPARVMTSQLLGREDEELVNQLVVAFEEILTHRPIGVTINWS